RAVSPSGGEESSSKGTHGSQSTPSKWVSGGFDLEEHIAALPQLGDTHLLNALGHSKANKGIIGNKTTVNNLHNARKVNHESNESVELSGEGQNKCRDISNCNDVTEKSKNISKLCDDTKKSEPNTPKHHNSINANVSRECGSRKVSVK